ncbi:MAG: undecaprenyldiphospho-muramoylpentapeptide beta-N-acetylglucosaminyltransferase [Minisyncoccales bacterium]
MKILFAGGGSGGHIMPIIAIVREFKKLYQGTDIKFYFIGPKDDFSNELLTREGIIVRNIFAGKIRRYINWQSVLQNIIDILIKIPLGFIESFFYIFYLSPDLIFSKGGFGSIPPVLAGKILLVPIFFHESDVIPGLANKFLSRSALEIFTSFRETEYYFPIKKILITGNPIRKELLGGSKQEAKQLLNLTLAKPVLLILGGSQGAQRINDRILEILPQLLENFEIIHQCGKNNYDSVKSEAKIIINEEMAKFYHLYPFLEEEELKQAYAAADLIVSRAGSGTIFEIAAVNKPAILIPLPEAAQNHQVKNAYAYQASRAAIVIEENNFIGHFFLKKLKDLFDEPDQLKKMAEKAKEFARPEAGRVIASYLLIYLLKKHQKIPKK